jgi:ElaB/YqjD/DUF883 family membrane-anchored ribosome-binding protein
MPSVLNPIIDMYQTQLEASRRFADVVFSGTEKIDHVMIEAKHRAFTEQLDFVQAITNARDPKGVASLQSTYISRRPETTANYQKEMVRILAEIQSDLGKSMQEYIERLGTNVANNATTPLKFAQEQTNDSRFNPVSSMFSVWESALKEVASLAGRNMSTARSSYENAANATRSATSATADATRMAAGAASEITEASSNVINNAASNITDSEGSISSPGSVNADNGQTVGDRKPQSGGSKRK